MEGNDFLVFNLKIVINKYKLGYLHFYYIYYLMFTPNKQAKRRGFFFRSTVNQKHDFESDIPEFSSFPSDLNDKENAAKEILM